MALNPSHTELWGNGMLNVLALRDSASGVGMTSRKLKFRLVPGSGTQDTVS